MRLRNPLKRDPAPPAFGAGKTIPEVTASWFSRGVFNWLNPFMSVGFSRPLETDDLWALADSQLTEGLADKLEARFNEQKAALAIKAEGSSEEKTVHDEEKGPVEDPKTESASKEKEPSLFWALYNAHFSIIWTSGVLNLIGDTLQTTTPLVTEVFLTWLVHSYAWVRLSDEERLLFGVSAPRGIGYGIGIAIAIFGMQEVSSLTNNIGYKMAMAYGQDMRASLIGALFRKSLKISGKARIEHNTGQVITMVSTDATNVEQYAAFAHQMWIAPIQLILAIALLIKTLGYSALVGLGVMVVSFPLQGLLVTIMYVQREKAIKITDKRVQLTSEVLQGIRLIKCYGWETFYLKRIGELRGQEVKCIRKGAIALAGMFALFDSIPVIAAVLSFITYSLTDHDLNVATIFAGLQLFNVLRLPLLFLPLVLSSLSSAMIALNRMSKFLSAEELAEPYQLDPTAANAVYMDGDFAWEAVKKPKSEDDEKKDKEKEKEEKGKKEKKDKKEKKKGKKGSTEADVLPTTSETPAEGTATPPVEEKPFELNGLRFSVPRGSFVAVVGRIGSGKSSLLQALIGEMKKTRGHVVVGGSMSYVPQAPWIQNTSLRENVTFGLPDDEERFRETVACCSLEQDIAALPHGEQTEIGEKGINLSGGQKARISLARAAYSSSDIVLLDDPLSAVDAHVGKAILDNCILNGPLANRTRILVTHALHVLDKADRIFVMENGVIVEQGKYEDLLAQGGSLTRLVAEFGKQQEGTSSDSPSNKVATEHPGASKRPETSSSDDADGKKAQEALMQLEERNTGAVGWETYKTWVGFAGGVVWIPLFAFLLGTSEAIKVGTNLWLSFWTSSRVEGFTNAQYIGVYAGFGMATATFTFILCFAFFAGGLVASLRIFKAALAGIMRSPLSFFDTTPMGRILSRLSKDQETLDNELAIVLYSFISVFVSVFGVITLVFYTFPYLGIAFAPLSVTYYLVSLYYRASSVEAKRLDSILRSALYATISETLTGLSTIRAYRVQDRALTKASEGLDVQNRAYYLSLVMQRWLALRLDLFGNMLVLGIGLFAAGFRHDVNPASIGVVLTYTLSFTMIFSEMIAQFAQNEQNMNAVERVVHYTRLPTEGALTTTSDPTPGSWPSKGQITFKDVELAYRPGLPLVLKGVNFEIASLEKVGIVGRTGAGKSSLLQALFRTVELSGGSIEIDGVDISTIGLDALRSNLALVPQDNVLFMGTLRENLDPQGQRTDAELISALQRVSLIPSSSATTSDPNNATAPTGQDTTSTSAKFALDALVGDDGSNYSAGEKQLLALARAIARGNKVIVLDEATSSVDVETDAKVQRAIRGEFGGATLLCVAHRLNTIAFYDRVLVMDQGRVAEFGTVLGLFDQPGSEFRALCDEAGLSRADIVRIREGTAASGFSSKAASARAASEVDLAEEERG